MCLAPSLIKSVSYARAPAGLCRGKCQTHGLRPFLPPRNLGWDSARKANPFPGKSTFWPCPLPLFLDAISGTLSFGNARQSRASPSQSEQMAWHSGNIQAYSFKNSTNQATVPGKQGVVTRLVAQASRAFPGADSLESDWRRRRLLLQTSQFDSPRLVTHDPSFSQRQLLDLQADGQLQLWYLGADLKCFRKGSEQKPNEIHQDSSPR